LVLSSIWKGTGWGSIIICEGEAGRPIALLPGRDGVSLREWLQKNKQVKIVTRDRANAYASAIKDTLPEAAQIADKFHIFHNLLDAVKDVVKTILPERIPVDLHNGDEADDKCVAGSIVEGSDAVATVATDNIEKEIPILPLLSKNEEDNRDLILEVQRLYREECLSKKEIKDKVGISFRRIKRYLEGDANTVCRDGRNGGPKKSALDPYYTIIHEMLSKHITLKDIFKYLSGIGYTGGYSTLATYCAKRSGNKKNGTTVSNGCDHFMSRKEVINNIWSDQNLQPEDKKFLFTKYPELTNLKEIVVDFKKAMDTEKVPLLGQWIDNILTCGFSALNSLGKGMKADIEAVLNSIRFQENNGFLEGNVNRLKMIKRTMFGRAKFPLIRAKILRLCAYD
jgi:hypothetical protein